MPNHIKNILKFQNLTNEDKEFILEKFTRELKDDIYPLNKIFDFDRIIPQPRKESDCPPEYKVNKDSHISIDESRPWFDWYRWNINHWGTKWGAYDGFVKVGKTYIQFIFSTAWSAPLPVYEQLSKDYPLFQWEVRYADEDIGSNCGHLIHKPGFMEVVHITEEDLGDPERFARRVWGYE